MVYAKKSYSRRPYRKRSYNKSTQYFSTAGKALATASTALTLARGIKSLINVEKKYYDKVESTGADINTTLSTAISPTAGLAQGDTTNTRDGDSIKLYSMNVRYNVDNFNNADYTTRFRVIGVYFPTVNTDLITAADVVTDTTNIDSPYSKDFSGFTVIHDKTFQLSGSSSYNLPVEKTVQFTWKPKNVHVKWTTADTTGADAALLRGQVRFFIMSETFTTAKAKLKFYVRTNFIDN